MKRLPLGKLRLRLMLLVVLAVIPAVSLLVYSDLQNRQQAISAARDDVLEAARQAGRIESRAIGQARQLFMTLSHFPPVLQQDAASCNKIFAQLMRNTKGYSAFLLTGPDGVTFATYPLKKKPINLVDRAYFQEALRTGEFVVGNYIIGRVSGKPVLSMAYPVKNASGKIVAVFAGGLETDWLTDLLAQAHLPAGAHLAVIDINGRLLAHNPPEPKLIGKPQFAQAIAKSITDQSQGVYEGEDSHGEKRFFGFTRLGKAPGAIYVLFSVPENKVFAEADRALVRDLTLAAIMALLALLVAWFIGTASVVKPVKRLLQVSQRVAAGDLEARVGGDYGAGELGLLAQGFDDMAKALEQRQKERERTEQTLRENEVRFQTVADFTYDWEWWRGMDGDFIYISPSCKRITGYEAEKFIKDKNLFLDLVHPDDRELVTTHLQSDLYDDKPVEMDFKIITKGGKTVWIEHISQPVYGPNGERLGRRASNRDGTERRQVMETLAKQNALITGQAQLAELLRGNQDMGELSRKALSFLCEHLGYQVGALYLSDESGVLKLAGSYALHGALDSPGEISPGQGLVGQAALTKKDITVSEVPKAI